MSDVVDINALLTSMRDDYIRFMNKMVSLPGAAPQKHQAFLRFDEGHMWMQNAVSSYVPEPEGNANDKK